MQRPLGQGRDHLGVQHGGLHIRLDGRVLCVQLPSEEGREACDVGLDLGREAVGIVAQGLAEEQLETGHGRAGGQRIADVNISEGFSHDCGVDRLDQVAVGLALGDFPLAGRVPREAGETTREGAASGRFRTSYCSRRALIRPTDASSETGSPAAPTAVRSGAANWSRSWNAAKRPPATESPRPPARTSARARESGSLEKGPDRRA
mmetsp:Transcript_8477/g.27780  ORF Transcript_8477/g.27780 Transcript_8477/m.27780 type:complete len:206 (+) Transcript_8477:455-1072(+)